MMSISNIQIITDILDLEKINKASNSLVAPKEALVLKALSELRDPWSISVKMSWSEMLRAHEGISKEQASQLLTRIEKEYIDFVLTDYEMSDIICLIELVDQNDLKKNEDSFVFELCKALGIPLVRHICRDDYSRSKGNENELILYSEIFKAIGACQGCSGGLEKELKEDSQGEYWQLRCLTGVSCGAIYNRDGDEITEKTLLNDPLKDKL